MATGTITPLRFKSDPERILVVMPTWVGDCVMATPFMAALVKRFPQASFTVVLHKHLVLLLKGHEWFTDPVCWPADGERKAFIGNLRQRRFDLALLLPNSFSSARLAWQVRAKRRVGFGRDGRSLLLTDPIKPPNKAGRQFVPVPQVDYYGYLAEHLGCAPTGDRLQLICDPADDALVAQRLQLEDDQPLVVICPGAKFGASKLWFPERFAGVADRLVDTHGAAVVISPGPGEEPLAHAILQAMTKPAQLLEAPCLNLSELKSLIARSQLLLGNDTGPRHFARAFDVPRVTIFGPTDRRWTDTSHDKEIIASVDVPCGPCHHKQCPLAEQVCMLGVSVDTVTNACAQLLADYRK